MAGALVTCHPPRNSPQSLEMRAVAPVCENLLLTLTQRLITIGVRRVRAMQIPPPRKRYNGSQWNCKAVSKLSRSWAKVTHFGNGVESTPSSVATTKRPSVSAPFDHDTLSLQGKEYYECGNGNSTRKRGCSDAERKRTVGKVKFETSAEGARTSCILTTNQGIAS